MQLELNARIILEIKYFWTVVTVSLKLVFRLFFSISIDR